MTWQGVPWALGAWTVNGVSGTPQTPAEAARVVAYQALGGGEGPAAAGDCAVVPLDVPGGAVNIRPGTVGILNRFPGGSGQAYVARNVGSDQVNITATGSGGGRTDLIAVIIEDPQYAGQPTPADGATGPYVRTAVYEGVGANVTKLSDVDANQSGYALARVTLPASTGTVQASHITDLRSLPNPRTRQETKILNIGNQADVVEQAGAYERFPQQAGWTVRVPSWAVRVHLELYVSGIRVKNDADAAGDWKGKARAKLGSVVTDDVELNPTPPDANKTDTFTYMAAGDLPVPGAIRGTDQTLEAQAFKVSSSSGVTVSQGWGTTVVAKATFHEDASTDSFTV